MKRKLFFIAIIGVSGTFTLLTCIGFAINMIASRTIATIKVPSPIEIATEETLLAKARLEASRYENERQEREAASIYRINQLALNAVFLPRYAALKFRAMQGATWTLYATVLLCIGIFVMWLYRKAFPVIQATMPSCQDIEKYSPFRMFDNEQALTQWALHQTEKALYVYDPYSQVGQQLEKESNAHIIPPFDALQFFETFQQKDSIICLTELKLWVQYPHYSHIMLMLLHTARKHNITIAATTRQQKTFRHPIAQELTAIRA